MRRTRSGPSSFRPIALSSKTLFAVTASCACWILLEATSGGTGLGSRHVAAEQAPACPIEIGFPRPGERLRHDVVPIWLLSRDVTAFERMTVEVNGQDLTRFALPWGASQRKHHGEVILSHAPRPGINRLLVQVLHPGGGVSQREVEYFFEPREMAVAIRVEADGQSRPARISFHGLGSTADPQLAPEIWREIGGESDATGRNFVYTEDGTVALHLPRGRYEVLAMRGPAHSVARAEIGPHVTSAHLKLERVVDTSGWISADFHVHASPSADSGVPLWNRITGFRAQDVDAIVASDHHTITDYRADLAGRYDWPADFEAIPGVEARPSNSRGHWNFWPLVRQEDSVFLRGGGSINFGGWPGPAVATPAAMYVHFERQNRKRRIERFGDFPVVVQLNHPRGIRFAPHEPDRRVWDYLNEVRYDAHRTLGEVSNGGLLARPEPQLPRPIDIDAIELLNRLSFQLYLSVRRDWFAWIAEGHVPTAVANSDSHWIVVTEAGYPRNWVRHDPARPITASALARSVRRHQVVGSTGPLLTLEPWSEDGSPIRGPLESLTVTVRSPAWIPVEEVRLYVDGKLARQTALAIAPTDHFALDERVQRVSFPLRLTGDAFITVEAGDRIERLLSEQPHEGPLGMAFPGLRVLAFSNPLLVDLDGDGSRWDRAAED